MVAHRSSRKCAFEYLEQMYLARPTEDLGIDSILVSFKAYLLYLRNALIDHIHRCKVETWKRSKQNILALLLHFASPLKYLITLFPRKIACCNFCLSFLLSSTYLDRSSRYIFQIVHFLAYLGRL